MGTNNKTTNINISTLTMLKVIIIVATVYFLYLIREILVIFFVSLVLASAIGPWVDWMRRKKIPRSLGIISIYLILFSFIGVIVYLLIPPIIEQVKDLTVNLPIYVEKITSSFSAFRDYTLQHGILDNIKNTLSNFSSELSNAPNKVLSVVSGFFGGIFSFLLILAITFYMLVEENVSKKIVWSIVPEQYQLYTTRLINRMQGKIGLWLRGQLILSLIVFSLIFIGLSFLHVKYALILALIAGLTEFIPYLGPVLAAIPAVLLTITYSPSLAIVVAILYGIINWMESNIIVPNLMQKVVGLNPIVIIAVLLVGFKLAGVLGAILSIPVATATSVFVKDLFDKKTAQS